MPKSKDGDEKATTREIRPGDVDNAKPGGDGTLPVNMTPQPVTETDAARANKLHDERLARQEKLGEIAEEEDKTKAVERPARSRRDEAIKAGEPIDNALRPEPDEEGAPVFQQTGTLPPQLGGHESIAHREGVRPENLKGLDAGKVPEGNKADGKGEEGVTRNPTSPAPGPGEDPGV